MNGVPEPHVRVVRGAPDEVEVAALVAGILAVASPATDDDLTRPSGWADRCRRLRGTAALHHGPGVWQWSMHP